jgi:hypothetical protein
MHLASSSQAQGVLPGVSIHRVPRSRVREVRRPFRPARSSARYQLPHEVRDRLVTALKPYRNRAAALALAEFVACSHSGPGRVALAFPIDRRELAKIPGLDLTEAKIRGAIRVLEEVAYLDRDIEPPGSRYKPTPEGLHRKPVLYVFGGDYARAFIEANERAYAAARRRSRERRPNPSDAARQPSAAPASVFSTKSPKDTRVADQRVSLGELAKGGIAPKRDNFVARPPAAAPDPAFEASLARYETLFFGRRAAESSRADPAVPGTLPVTHGTGETGAESAPSAGLDGGDRGES